MSIGNALRRSSGRGFDVRYVANVGPAPSEGTPAPHRPHAQREILGGELSCHRADTGRNEMDAATLAVLNETEKLLIAETDREALAALDEEAAIELETRIRRTRNKYVSQYRRAASARVESVAAAARRGRRTRVPRRKPRRSNEPFPGSADGSRSWPGSPRRRCAPSGWRWPGPRNNVTGRAPRRWCPPSAVRAPPPRPTAPGTAPCATRPASGTVPERSPRARASRPGATASAPRRVRYLYGSGIKDHR